MKRLFQVVLSDDTKVFAYNKKQAKAVRDNHNNQMEKEGHKFRAVVSKGPDHWKNS